MLILKCIKTIHILRSWSNYTHCLDKEDASFLLTINQVRSVFPNLFHSVQLPCIHCHYCHHPELHPPAQVAGLSISMAMAIITIYGRHRRPHHGHPPPPPPPPPPPRDHDEIGVSGGP